MKKIVLVLVLVISVISLTACDPKHYFFKYEELKDKVVSIQLIEYDNPSVKKLPRTVESPYINCKWSRKPDPVETQPFDFTKVNVLGTLSEDKIDDFLQELSEIEFFTIDTYYTGATDSANGITIILNYNDGNFLVLSADRISTPHSQFAALYDSDGNPVEQVANFINNEYFYDLVALILRHIVLMPQ